LIQEGHASRSKYEIEIAAFLLSQKALVVDVPRSNRDTANIRGPVGEAAEEIVIAGTAKRSKFGHGGLWIFVARALRDDDKSDLLYWLLFASGRFRAKLFNGVMADLDASVRHDTSVKCQPRCSFSWIVGAEVC
jgi:hypothetical protein